ncbi:hypothetical protein BC826DRAFT_1109027 [Russula brevipes]|nr:hypothetical protein BC826DRAFT_1109027 [Russula brevipes]
MPVAYLIQVSGSLLSTARVRSNSRLSSWDPYKSDGLVFRYEGLDKWSCRVAWAGHAIVSKLGVLFNVRSRDPGSAPFPLSSFLSPVYKTWPGTLSNELRSAYESSQETQAAQSAEIEEVTKPAIERREDVEAEYAVPSALRCCCLEARGRTEERPACHKLEDAGSKLYGVRTEFVTGERSRSHVRSMTDSRVSSPPSPPNLFPLTALCLRASALLSPASFLIPIIDKEPCYEDDYICAH